MGRKKLRVSKTDQKWMDGWLHKTFEICTNPLDELDDMIAQCATELKAKFVKHGKFTRFTKDYDLYLQYRKEEIRAAYDKYLKSDSNGTFTFRKQCLDKDQCNIMAPVKRMSPKRQAFLDAKVKADIAALRNMTRPKRTGGICYGGRV